MLDPDERYSRQEGLFGREGQRRLDASSVAIVGLGGLGSHVAQQLAYLGVRHFTLIDHDHVERSNLNRLIGATDVDVGALKVVVAARIIAAIQPEAEIVSLATRLEAVPDGALDAVGVAFGCVDDDAVRLELVQRCVAARIASFDIATDTGDGFFGGRVLFSGDGNRCVSCMDVLDQVAMRRAAMTAGQRDEDRRIYGITGAALEGSGPAVVSLNGVVASLAVTEFVKWRTGILEPASLLTYRGDLGVVTRSLDPPRPACFYCSRWAAA